MQRGADELKSKCVSVDSNTVIGKLIGDATRVGLVKVGVGTLDDITGQPSSVPGPCSPTGCAWTCK